LLKLLGENPKSYNFVMPTKICNRCQKFLLSTKEGKNANKIALNIDETGTYKTFKKCN